MKKFSGVAENRTDGKLFNFRPALFAAAFFALGIAFAYGKTYRDVSLWWLTAAVPFFAAAIFFAKERRKALVGAAALCLCFSVGTLAFISEVDAFSDCRRYEGEYTVVGTVTEKEEYGKISVLYLTELRIGGNRAKGTLTATLDADLAKEIRLSDEVILTGEIETETDAFGDFGFRAEEIAGRVRYCAFASAVDVTGRSENIFRAVRSRIKDALYSGMDEDSAAVTYALLTGDSAGIDRGLLENVRRGGVAHIFAVSGLHVGALYAFCLALFEKTKLKRTPRPLRFALLLFILFFYAGICGFSPSTVRAAAVCAIFYASSLIGTKSDMLENTGIAALLLLGIHPVSLFDVGFQLSFAACLSIGILSRTFRDVFFAPFEKRAAKREKRGENETDGFLTKAGKAASSFFAVTLSAQIGTAPILLSAFGYLSVWGFLLNCVFVPLVGAAFSILIVWVFAAALLPLAAAKAVLFVPSAIWSAVLLVFYAADFSFVLSDIRLGSGAILFYLFFIVLSDKIQLSKGKKRLAGTILAAGCVLCAAIVSPY